MDCLCVAHNKSYSRQSWPSVCLLSLHSTYLVVSNYPRLLVFILCEYMMLVMKLWCWHVAVLFGALLGKRLTNIYDTHVLVLCTHTHTHLPQGVYTLKAHITLWKYFKPFSWSYWYTMSMYVCLLSERKKQIHYIAVDFCPIGTVCCSVVFKTFWYYNNLRHCASSLLLQSLHNSCNNTYSIALYNINCI